MLSDASMDLGAHETWPFFQQASFQIHKAVIPAGQNTPRLSMQPCKHKRWGMPESNLDDIISARFY